MKAPVPGSTGGGAGGRGVKGASGSATARKLTIDDGALLVHTALRGRKGNEEISVAVEQEVGELKKVAATTDPLPPKKNTLVASAPDKPFSLHPDAPATVGTVE